MPLSPFSKAIGATPSSKAACRFCSASFRTASMFELKIGDNRSILCAFCFRKLQAMGLVEVGNSKYNDPNKPQIAEPTSPTARVVEV